MGHAGTLPLVPEELVGDVISTSWSLANTRRDPKLVLHAEPTKLSTECPSCHDRLLIEIVASSDAAVQQRNTLELPVGRAMRHATRVAKDASLSTATELLMLCPRRVVVVVDAQHHPLGVITPCEIASALGNHPDQLSSMSALQAAAPSDPVLPEHARLGAAANILAREDRDFALVVDHSGALAGVLMATDVLDAQIRAAGRPY